MNSLFSFRFLSYTYCSTLKTPRTYTRCLRAKQALKASELMRAAYHEKEVQFNPIKDNQRPTASARATEKETHTRRHRRRRLRVVAAQRERPGFREPGGSRENATPKCREVITRETEERTRRRGGEAGGPGGKAERLPGCRPNKAICHACRPNASRALTHNLRGGAGREEAEPAPLRRFSPRNCTRPRGKSELFDGALSCPRCARRAASMYRARPGDTSN